MHQHTNYRGPRRRREKKRYEKIFDEITVENFPNVEKKIVNEVQEAQRVPYRINPRKNTPRHILIKLTKNRFKTLKIRRKQKKKKKEENSTELQKPNVEAEVYDNNRK